MKIPVSKKILIGIGAAMAVAGDALAYYFNTATRMETVDLGLLGEVTRQVPYETDYVTGMIALAVIGVVILLLGALVDN